MLQYIYINGYPGVGKLTVAKELEKLIPGSKIYHNHLLIDPVAPLVERTSPHTVTQYGLAYAATFWTSLQHLRQRNM
ncbi:hypothetical protein QBC33DRAFT_83827 [Phialemonium atrogriseum]|uniref:Uncharacterized protein n=1 Tax=Phialemonium atrogriseum TaxID=1093897 RepID=A0AAJ0C090_9PEZI|nr:uncharacterized protein QBC33DRAFT_83827 [Phialemonium atrogriseum]KAK1766698.1 hypothetical protein QBC33DRAFT_83827 [Phialemonium atrogriseum]